MAGNLPFSGEGCVLDAEGQVTLERAGHKLSVRRTADGHLVGLEVRASLQPRLFGVFFCALEDADGRDYSSASHKIFLNDPVFVVVPPHHDSGATPVANANSALRESALAIVGEVDRDQILRFDKNAADWLLKSFKGLTDDQSRLHWKSWAKQVAEEAGL